MINPDTIKAWCETTNSGSTFYGKNNAPSVVIIGEKGNDRGHRMREEAMIELVQPSIIMADSLGSYTYNPFTSKTGFVSESTHNTLDEIELKKGGIAPHFMKWAHQYGSFLIGIDMTNAERDILAERIERNFPGYETTSQSLLECEARQAVMGERISAYASMSKEPVVAIVGAYHVQDSSMIHPILQKEGIDYVCLELPDIVPISHTAIPPHVGHFVEN